MLSPSLSSNSLHGFHISIYGNIGAGKSTLARLLQEKTKGNLLLEDPEQYTFVKDAFDDPHRWSFTNQAQFILRKVAQQAQIRNLRQITIQEMDVHATHYIWTPVLHEMGYVSTRELNLINETFELLTKLDLSIPNLYIFTKSSHDNTKKRILHRGRDYEVKNLAHSQLLTLLEASLDRFYDYTRALTIVIDTNRRDFVGNPEDQDHILKQILDLIPSASSK